MKPILVLYMGYAPPLIGEDKSVRGSELMARKLISLLKNYYDIHVFGIYDKTTENNIKYYPLNELYDFQLNNKIEILLISRYINYFLEYPINAKKTYVWVHDIGCLLWWKAAV